MHTEPDAHVEADADGGAYQERERDCAAATPDWIVTAAPTAPFTSCLHTAVFAR